MPGLNCETLPALWSACAAPGLLGPPTLPPMNAHTVWMYKLEAAGVEHLRPKLPKCAQVCANPVKPHAAALHVGRIMVLIPILIPWCCAGTREPREAEEPDPEQKAPQGNYTAAQEARRFMIYVHSKYMVVDDEVRPESWRFRVQVLRFGGAAQHSAMCGWWSRRAGPCCLHGGLDGLMWSAERTGDGGRLCGGLQGRSSLVLCTVQGPMQACVHGPSPTL